MKYGMLVPQNFDEPAENHILAGFYQWLNVFGGRTIRMDDALHHLNDGDYDIIHIQLTRENLLPILQLRERLGTNPVTKIVLSLDIPVRYWG